MTHPAKCEITPTENIFTFLGGYTWAIYRHSYYGPKVGSDLVIHVDAARKSSSEARLGSHYSVPASLADMFKILARRGRLVKKQWYFSPDEVEVFYLDPSP